MLDLMDADGQPGGASSVAAANHGHVGDDGPRAVPRHVRRRSGKCALLPSPGSMVTHAREVRCGVWGDVGWRRTNHPATSAASLTQPLVHLSHNHALVSHPAALRLSAPLRFRGCENRTRIWVSCLTIRHSRT